MRSLELFTPAAVASSSLEQVRDAAVGERDERAQVDREPGHGRLGDAPRVAPQPPRTAGAVPVPRARVLDSRCSWLAGTAVEGTLGREGHRDCRQPTLGVCERGNKIASGGRLPRRESSHVTAGPGGVGSAAQGVASEPAGVDPPEVVLRARRRRSPGSPRRTGGSARGRWSMSTSANSSPSSAQTAATTARASSQRWQPGPACRAVTPRRAALTRAAPGAAAARWRAAAPWRSCR